MHTRTNPELIDELVSAHFHAHGEEMKESIRGKVEDEQLKLLDDFFQKIQANYVDRIAALEELARLNNETLQQVQGSSARAAEDLRRLSEGIHGLIGPA